MTSYWVALQACWSFQSDVQLDSCILQLDSCILQLDSCILQLYSCILQYCIMCPVKPYVGLTFHHPIVRDCSHANNCFCHPHQKLLEFSWGYIIQTEHFELPVYQSRMIVHIASSYTILSASLIFPLFYCQFPDGMNKVACCDVPTPALFSLPGASLFGNFFLTAGGTGGKHLRVTCSFHVDIVYNVG